MVGLDNQHQEAFVHTPVRVVVDLKKQFANQWFDGETYRDTLKNVEHIRGTRGGNDKLFGSSANETLEGHAGTDLLKGRGGRDKLEQIPITQAHIRPGRSSFDTHLT